MGDDVRPDLSVVLVTPAGLDTVRTTLEHLAAQTVAGRLEVILVAPDEAVAEEVEDALAERFLDVRVLGVGPVSDVDKAAAGALRGAAAEFVAMVEDHAYPEPEWAAALIERHRSGPWAAVGSTVLNGNPATVASWTNQLMAYGDFTAPVTGGAAVHISRHNLSLRKDVLDAYGDRLVEYLGRGGGLLGDLRRQGHRFYLEPRARIRHVNPSRLRSTLELRFFGGWLAGAARARRERPSPLRRGVMMLVAPVVTMTRLRKMALKLMTPEHRRRLPRVLPAVVGALLLEGAGQVMGIARGVRGTDERLAAFEFDRFRHLTPADRARLGRGRSGETGG